jgi:hypothetical protein
MNIDTNPEVPPGQPDDEPTVATPGLEDNEMTSDHPEPDILDVINETVAQISDADIEERLRQTLHRAG